MRNLIRFCIALTIMLALGVLYFIAQPAHAQDSCVMQPTGMVAWYPGDGNANDIQGGNNGTLSTIPSIIAA